MPKKSKRFEDVSKSINKEQLYTLPEAVKLAKAAATSKFDETVEVHFNLGIDPRQGDQQIRATVTLPHGTGKNIRVAAFVDSANETAAKEAGADIVANEEFIDKLVQTGKIEFDVAVAVPTMMPKLAKAARVLGPRGLMPNPKTDTVSPNVAKMIEEQKGGKTAFKNDNTSNVHVMCGKASFDAAKLVENIETVFNTVKRARPSATKGTYIKSMTITTTMGPAIRVDASSL